MTHLHRQQGPQQSRAGLNADHGWFRVRNAASNPSLARIEIIDFIGGWLDATGSGFGVTAKSFAEQLTALPSSVTAIDVHINSPGGDVQAGVNIANMLREQRTAKGRTVKTFVDGLAASIASVIAMAGSEVHMADNALMMIHDPWAIEIGNAATMRKTAEALDAIKTQIVTSYQWHSTLREDVIAAMMSYETWMDATEAIQNGFATHKIGNGTASAQARAQANTGMRAAWQAAAATAASRAPSTDETWARAFDRLKGGRA